VTFLAQMIAVMAALGVLIALLDHVSAPPDAEDTLVATDLDDTDPHGIPGLFPPQAWDDDEAWQRFERSFDDEPTPAPVLSHRWVVVCRNLDGEVIFTLGFFSKRRALRRALDLVDPAGRYRTTLVPAHLAPAPSWVAGRRSVHAR
jgi:hypothetical protein